MQNCLTDYLLWKHDQVWVSYLYGMHSWIANLEANMDLYEVGCYPPGLYNQFTLLNMAIY